MDESRRAYLIDELARTFARAAVDAFLAESVRKHVEKPPVAADEGQRRLADELPQKTPDQRSLDNQ